MVIKMPIDLKSLYLNIKNDNRTGHTPTVATPLRQGSSIHSEIAQILMIPETISATSKEELALHILSKSRAEAKITNAFVFDMISVNGIPVETNALYCIYIREETSRHNVHFGRQKVHYPQVLKFENEEVFIDNQSVIRSISSVLNDYAFLVQAFEYDTETGILNFDVQIIGYGGIPYSKVFMNKRGVGEKFSSVFKEYADTYDTEIIALRDALGYENVGPNNFHQVMESNRALAVSIVCDHLMAIGSHSIKEVSSLYPYSLYDLEAIDNQSKRYIIVCFTSTKRPYFSLPSKQIRFLNEFSEQVDIYIVTDINGTPNIKLFSSKDINNCKKIISSVTFELREE